MKTTITILATFLSLGLRAQTEPATISDDVAQAGQASFELVSFVATPVNGDGVRLQWSTGSEAPNSAFHIQRSSDGANWRTVITQDGEGGGSGYSFYEVMDLAPEHGVTHYRLLALVPARRRSTLMSSPWCSTRNPCCGSRATATPHGSSCRWTVPSPTCRC